MASSEWRTPIRCSLFAIRVFLSAAHVERRQRGHVDQLGIVGRERHDLHRPVEPDQDRTDDGRATHLLQQFGRDRGGMERRHDQHVRRSRQAAEGICLPQFRIERDIGGHVAVILEIDAALVEDAHRALDMCRALARRVAEGGEGEQCHARLVAEAPRNPGGLDRDIGEILGVWHLVHRGVGDEHGAAARQHQRHTHHAVAGFGIDAAAHVRERHREVAGDARDHGIGVAERDHAGGKMVAVLVHQALHIALQEPLTLQPLVEIGGVGGVALRQPRIDDLDAVAELDAEMAGAFTHAILATDQQRGAEVLLHEARGGADHLLFLAFGEHHALRAPPQALGDLLQHAGGRVAARAQLRDIGFHVHDRAARDAGVHGGLGDRRRHEGDQPRIERHRDDVVRAELRSRAICGRDLVGHVLARERGERVGGRDLHLHVDGGRAHVEGAAEDVGEAEHIVDLIRVVGSPGGHDGVAAHLGHLLRRNLRIGIGHGEDDRLVRHGLDHLLGHRALDGEAEEHVGADERLGERAGGCLDRVRRLPLVHALGAALVDHALGVAEDDVLGREADRLEQLERGDAGSAGAVAHELGRFDVASGQVKRVEQPGRRDDGGTVLVVMEDGNVEQLPQPLLDDEALRRLDVLEIDAAPALAQQLDAIDDLIGIFRRHFEIDGVDIGEALEQHRLAFHHRLGGERPAIAQPENGCAVGDDGDEIALGGVVEGAALVLGDGQYRHRDARRIGQRQVALRRHRLGGHDLELAGPALAVEQQGFLIGERRSCPTAVIF